MIRPMLTMLFATTTAIAHAAHTRWTDNGNRTVTDTATALVWTASDSREDVDWEGAKRYCSKLALADGHWRLPGIEELAALHGRDRGWTYCTPLGWPVESAGEARCKVSPLFYLSAFTVWSATPATRKDGEARAWIMNFNDGKRYAEDVSQSPFNRALCVRGS